MRKVLIILLALGLSACATDRPLSFGCTRLADFSVPVPETPIEYAPDLGSAPGEVGAASAELPGSELGRAFAAGMGGARIAAAGPPSVLVLSGGGQWGAFGAGYLRRWTSTPIGGEVRPVVFDIVTGVSTGSLQATYAFLGSTQDEGLVAAYRIASEGQLVQRHGNLFFIRHASMADTAPLERYVRARVGPLIDRVAAQDPARKLYVGIVDGLTGRMIAVDLTRISREMTGPERTDCYVGALLGSSAVPVVFRQVRIGGRPYLDGGVRQSVFVTGVTRAAGEAFAATARRGTVYVLINGDVTPGVISELPPKLLPTIGRLRSIVFNQVELASIYGVARSTPGMRTMVATAAGHDCVARPDEEEEVFSPRVMECLRAFGEGQHGAHQPEPWRSVASR
ncbi:patatin-like phospholipase family protein [Sphingomonas citri]